MFGKDNPNYLKTESLTEKWSQPKFDVGVSAQESAQYFESRGDKKRAQEIRQIQKIAGATPVYFVLAPKGVAAYVTPWSSRGVYYNLETLATGADHEHIITHEKIHLRQQAEWGDVEVPGFRELPSEIKALFAAELGIAELNDREIIEGLTENAATGKTRFDKRCAYNQFEVPMIKRLEALITDVTGMSITESFGMMSEGGSRPKFRKALLQTANYLILENTAESIVPGKLNTNQQETIRALGNYMLRKPQIVKMPEAKDILLKASADLIRTAEKTKVSVNTILGDEKDDIIITQGLNVEFESPDLLVSEGFSEMSVEILKKKMADKAIEKLGNGNLIISHPQS